MAAEERTTVMAGISPLQAPAEAGEPLPPAMELQRPEPAPSASAVSHNLPPLVPKPEEQPTAAPTQVTALAPSSSVPSSWAPSSSAPSSSVLSSSDPATHTPRSTAWSRKRLQQLHKAAAKEGQNVKTRAPTSNSCRRCGLRRIKETGHRVLRKPSGERVYYCPGDAKGLDPDEWLATL